MKKSDWRYIVDTLLFLCIFGISFIGILLAFFLPKGPAVDPYYPHDPSRPALVIRGGEYLVGLWDSTRRYGVSYGGNAHGFRVVVGEAPGKSPRPTTKAPDKPAPRKEVKPTSKKQPAPADPV